MNALQSGGYCIVSQDIAGAPVGDCGLSRSQHVSLQVVDDSHHFYMELDTLEITAKMVRQLLEV